MYWEQNNNYFNNNEREEKYLFDDNTPLSHYKVTTEFRISRENLLLKKQDKNGFLDAELKQEIFGKNRK